MIEIIYPQTTKTHAWYNYLLFGFQELEKQKKIKLTISPTIINPSPSIIPIQVKNFMVYYDFSDFIPLIKEIDNAPYFKIQYHEEHFKKKNVFPIGQTVTSLKFLEQLPNLRKLKNQKNYELDIIGLFRATNYKLRCKMVELIKKENFNSLVGVSGYRNRPPVPKNLQGKRIDYLEHLKKQCQSKICLSSPGVGNFTSFWSWRTTEILGMGCFLFTPPATCYLPNFPKKCWAEFNLDFSNMIDKINYYLKHDKEREEIAQNGRNYFDQYLRPDKMCNYLIEKTLEYYEK